MVPLISFSVGKMGLLGAVARPPVGRGSSRSSGEPDKADLSPVVGLAAMRGAAEAVEAGFIGIGVEVDGLDRTDPRSTQAILDICGQIEVGLCALMLREKPPVACICV